MPDVDEIKEAKKFYTDSNPKLCHQKADCLFDFRVILECRTDTKKNFPSPGGLGFSAFLPPSSIC